MKCKLKIDLSMFGDKDFFTQAFEEAYPITQNEEIPEGTEEPTDETKPEDNQVEDEVKDPEPTQPTLSDDELKRLYEEKFGKQETHVEKEEKEEKEVELDEETKSALELYKYLESNPHLVQAMKDVDIDGYQQLNTFVPDEITKKLNELESFKQEYEYNMYIKELQSKYNDFDEDKVLEYAEKNDVLNLEVAYKALKAESVKEPNVEELREQIKKELLEELKNNSINTQSIVGGISQKPITQDDEVSLTAREMRIAKAMGVSPKEYAKWR